MHKDYEKMSIPRVGFASCAEGACARCWLAIGVEIPFAPVAGVQPVRLPPATRLPAGQAPRLIMPAPQYGPEYDDREHAPPLDAALPGNCNCGRDPCVVGTGGLFWCAPPAPCA